LLEELLLETDQKSADLSDFTSDEIARFARRKEEGYDIKTDLRYNLWLTLQSTPSVISGPTALACPQFQSAVSKVIGTIPPTRIMPKLVPKTSCQVLTSEECLMDIIEKARKKEEALKRKEEKKIEREQKQMEKSRILLEISKKREKSMCLHKVLWAQ
jgi:hypothetical protein